MRGQAARIPDEEEREAACERRRVSTQELRLTDPMIKKKHRKNPMMKPWLYDRPISR